MELPEEPPVTRDGRLVPRLCSDCRPAGFPTLTPPAPQEPTAR